MALPEVTSKPCNECPWRREHAPGWLGPLTAEEWVELAHSDEPIACHLTIQKDGEFYGTRQCAGAAQYRTNVFKSPRDPEVATAGARDDSAIFGSAREFLVHHGGQDS
jgi:hypothetical protein